MFGFFGLGGLIYVGIFLINAVCVLSEDRFLARIGFTQGSQQASFGSTPEQSMGVKLVNLITSIRLVARGTWKVITRACGLSMMLTGKCEKYR